MWRRSVSPWVGRRPEGVVRDMDSRLSPLQGIHALEAFAQRLLLVIRQILDAPPLRRGGEDALALMALCFTRREAEHLRSILALVRAGQYRDAVLIARSMIEGVALLTWAAREPSTRPALWRKFAWIEHWRLMQEQVRSGELLDPLERNTVEEQVLKVGDQFLSRAAQDALRAGAALPADPYWPYWHEGKSVAKIFQELQGVPLYQYVYSASSRCIHWSPRGLGAPAGGDGDHPDGEAGVPECAAAALAAGFQTALETAMRLDAHLHLEFAGRLSDLRDEYVRDRKSTRLNSSHLVISYAVFCLKKKRQLNLDTLYATEIGGKEVASLAASYPMMGDRRVVIVREADKMPDKDTLLPYIGRPSPST